jgi:hypothetical protein
MFSQVLADITIGTNGDIANFRNLILATLPFFIPILIILVVTSVKMTRIRLEHKQIMAAIEKGIPISDLKIFRWKGLNAVTSIALAPAMFIVAVGFAYMFYLNQNDTGAFLGICICSGLGIFFLIRGILLRKYDKTSALDANNGQ